MTNETEAFRISTTGATGFRGENWLWNGNLKMELKSLPGSLKWWGCKFLFDQGVRSCPTVIATYIRQLCLAFLASTMQGPAQGPLALLGTYGADFSKSKGSSPNFPSKKAGPLFLSKSPTDSSTGPRTVLEKSVYRIVLFFSVKIDELGVAFRTNFPEKPELGCGNNTFFSPVLSMTWRIKFH